MPAPSAWGAGAAALWESAAVLDTGREPVLAPASADDWTNSAGGTWSTAADWSTGAVPDASSNATIAASGTYAVSIDAAAAANALTIDDSGATVTDTAKLAIGTTLAVTAGTFVLGNGGAIVGGTISTGASGVFDVAYSTLSSVQDMGTLSGVTYQGTLDVASATLTVLNGINLTGAGGSGEAILNLSTVNDLVGQVTVYDASSIGNVAINLQDDGTLEFINDRATDGTVTLAGDVAINGIEGNGVYSDGGGVIDLEGKSAAETLVNAGTLTAFQAGLQVDIVYAAGDDTQELFVNQGAISVAGGGLFEANLDTTNQGRISLAGDYGLVSLDLPYHQLATFTNSGTIDIAGGMNEFIVNGEFVNTGTIKVTGHGNLFDLGSTWTVTSGLTMSAGNTLGLGGEFTTATLLDELSLNHINGVVVSLDATASSVAGMVSNQGATLTLGGTGGLVLQLDIIGKDWAGTIDGGTIVDAGGGLRGDGTLDDVTYQGTLDVTASDQNIVIEGGFNTTAGTPPAVVNITGDNANLNFGDVDETFDNANIYLGADGGGASITCSSNPGTVTFGKNVTITQVGTRATILYGSDDGAYVINQGIISADVTGAAIDFVVASHGFGGLNNQGTLLATNGGTIDLSDAGKIGNLPGGTLTGGTWEANAGSVIQLLDNASVSTDAATIILSGAGSAMQGLDTTSKAEVTLDQTLRTISSAGTLELLAGRNFSADHAIRDAGTLELGGGSFAAGGLAVTATGTLSGFGTVTTTLINDGVVSASGGTLAFLHAATNDGTIDAGTGAVSFVVAVEGTGRLQVGAAGTLSLLHGAAAGQTLDFTAAGGLVDLAAADYFKATIENFAAGDRIDLINTAETSYAYAAGILTVQDNGATVAALHFAGAYTQSDFALNADGHTGTVVTFA